MANVDPAQELLAVRLAGIRGQIEAAAQKAGRAAGEVTLVAISKTHPASAVRTLIELGAVSYTHLTLPTIYSV